MQDKSKNIFLALVVMALWGSLFPMVKLGYKAFVIASGDVPQILMFAGIRFTVCGGIISLFSLLKQKKSSEQSCEIKKSIIPVLLVGLFSIILHYTCTYISLNLVDSSKTAILKQLGTLLYICFGFLFVKGEKFSWTKIVSAIIGFLGIVVINLNGNGFSFSLSDILIIVASICTVAGSLASKSAMKYLSPIKVTGFSQLFGGIVLVMVSLSLGGKFLAFNLAALPIFAYICCASIISYCLWNTIIKKLELSKMFIIKFSEPLLACLFGALILGENIFRWQYLFAFLLISLGIIIANHVKAE